MPRSLSDILHKIGSYTDQDSVSKLINFLILTNSLLSIYKIERRIYCLSPVTTNTLTKIRSNCLVISRENVCQKIAAADDPGETKVE